MSTPKAAARLASIKRVLKEYYAWQEAFWQRLISIIRVYFRLNPLEPIRNFWGNFRLIKHNPAGSLIFFLVVFVLGLNVFGHEQSLIKALAGKTFGGPEESIEVLARTSDLTEPLLESQRSLGGAEAIPEDFSGYFFVFEDSVAGWSNPVSEALSWVPKREEIIVYQVAQGDSPASIASNLGISLETVLWANNLNRASVIKPRDNLVILPVSGVIHEVKPGETLSQIARAYGISESRIAAVNSLSSPDNLSSGEKLVIPGGQPLGFRQASSSPAPRLASQGVGFFRAPATGWNWGRLHNYNAVDIANACGTPVLAAASGLVVEARLGGWNSGYGNFVQIEHSNATKTKYSHLSAVLVSEGAYVNQGDLIGAIGQTGKTHGPTGCHVHFEVQGARNPFAR